MRDYFSILKSPDGKEFISLPHPIPISQAKRFSPITIRHKLFSSYVIPEYPFTTAPPNFVNLIEAVFSQKMSLS